MNFLDDTVAKKTKENYGQNVIALRL